MSDKVTDKASVNSAELSSDDSANGVLFKPFSLITVKKFLLKDEYTVCKMVYILGVPVWKSLCPADLN